MTVLEPSSSLSQNKRRTLVVSPDDEDGRKKPCYEQSSQEESSLGTNTTTTTTTTTSQWLFQRHDRDDMVLSDHLGDASAMVESLTHQVDNWSLTNLSPSSKPNKQRCKAAKRQVMRAMTRRGQQSH